MADENNKTPPPKTDQPGGQDNNPARDGDKSGTAGSSNAGKGPSAQARARAAKAQAANAQKTSAASSKDTTPTRKPVTIDLEAKDVTPKEASTTGAQTKASASASQNATPEASKDASKDTLKPAAKSPEAKTSVKADAPTKSAGKPDTPKMPKPPEPKFTKPASSGGAATAGKGSSLATMFAAVVAAIVAVALFYGLQMMRILPTPGADGTAIEAEIAATRDLAEQAGQRAEQAEQSANAAQTLATTASEQAQAASEPTQPSVPAEIMTRISALETRVAELEANAQQAVAQAPILETQNTETAATQDAGERVTETTDATGTEDASENQAPVIAQTETTPASPPTSQLAQAPQTSALMERLNAIEARLGAAEETPDIDVPGIANDLRALQTRLTTLEGDLTTLNETAAQTQSAQQTANVDEAADTADASPALDATALTELTSRIGELETSIATTTTAIATLESSSGPDLAPLKAELADVGARLQATSSTVEKLSATLTDTTDSVAALGGKVETLEAGLSDAQSAFVSNQTAARALALNDLKTAAESGGTLLPAMAALERAGVSQDQLAPISPFADRGLEDLATLGTKLDPLIAQAIAMATPASDTTPTSGAEKLLENALSVIKIRRVDAQPEPDTPLDQMKAAFANGDPTAFDAAAAELSAEQQALFTEWRDAWQGNRALSTLISSLEGDLIGNNNTSVEDAPDEETPEQTQ